MSGAQGKPLSNFCNQCESHSRVSETNLHCMLSDDGKEGKKKRFFEKK